MTIIKYRLNIRFFFASLRSMENKQLERIEKLLTIIADELYVARNNRDLVTGAALSSWEPEREAIIQHIKEARADFRKHD